MRILLNIYPWYLPRRNRELRVHVDLMQLSRQFPDMSFERVTSPAAVVMGNASFLAQRALAMALPLPRLQRRYFYFALKHVNFVPASHVRRKRCDALFAHEYFPMNLGDSLLPLVYETQLLPESALAGYELPPVTRAFERRLKGACAMRSTLTLVRDPAAAEGFRALVPEAADRVRFVPWYVPYLEAVTEQELVRKQSTSDGVRVLFVGNEARRKGLPTLLEAFARLPDQTRSRAQLMVVSRFLDGPVEIGAAGIQVHFDQPQESVLALMRQAHILVLPTHADVFGIVLVEAMANGCAVVSSRQPPQDFILAGGGAGRLLAAGDAALLSSTLADLIEDVSARKALALSGRRHFLEALHHGPVGQRYRDLFGEAIEVWRSRGGGALRGGARA